MVIIYSDGGRLECSTISVLGGSLLADEFYNVDISEIDRIEED